MGLSAKMSPWVTPTLAVEVIPEVDRLRRFDPTEGTHELSANDKSEKSVIVNRNRLLVFFFI